MTGIVTLHDIIETLLGEIQEDDDIEEPDPTNKLILINLESMAKLTLKMSKKL